MSILAGRAQEIAASLHRELAAALPVEDAEAFPADVTDRERAILDAFHRGGAKSATAVAKLVGIRQADACKLVQGLRQRGLLPDLHPPRVPLSSTRDRPPAKRAARLHGTRTINPRRIPIAERRWFDQESTYPEGVARPKSRAECENGPRPCPFVTCRNHLALDVSRTGSIKVNFPAVLADMDFALMPATCALDVADRHEDGAPLPVVQAAISLSYDRTFQVIDEAKEHAREVAIEIGEDEGPWVWDRRRRKYTSKFRAEAVRLAKATGKGVVGAAKALGVSVSTLRCWKKQHEIEAGKGTLRYWKKQHEIEAGEGPDAGYLRTGDPELDHEISALVSASTPVFEKPLFRQLSSDEAAAIHPGAAISAAYGQPRLVPANTAGGPWPLNRRMRARRRDAEADKNNVLE